ncbi:hypothetical protein M758_UG129600 [Ceratodon purpureus]|nr:hypothetical protein M758_UG129600 [Ceratodon purpureus]
MCLRHRCKAVRLKTLRRLVWHRPVQLLPGTLVTLELVIRQNHLIRKQRGTHRRNKFEGRRKCSSRGVCIREEEEDIQRTLQRSGSWLQSGWSQAHLGRVLSSNNNR